MLDSDPLSDFGAEDVYVLACLLKIVEEWIVAQKPS